MEIQLKLLIIKMFSCFTVAGSQGLKDLCRKKKKKLQTYRARGKKEESFRRPCNILRFGYFRPGLYRTRCPEFPSIDCEVFCGVEAGISFFRRCLHHLLPSTCSGWLLEGTFSVGSQRRLVSTPTQQLKELFYIYIYIHTHRGPCELGLAWSPYYKTRKNKKHIWPGAKILALYKRGNLDISYCILEN